MVTEEELDLLLKYLGLVYCKKSLRKAGVHRKLKVTPKDELKCVLPCPAADRIDRKGNKFDDKIIKKSRCLPMMHFLAKLHLEDIEEKLNGKLCLIRKYVDKIVRFLLNQTTAETAIPVFCLSIECYNQTRITISMFTIGDSSLSVSLNEWSILKDSDLNEVRKILGDLKNLTADSICDALRFVHSVKLSSHIFFGRPPPEIKSNELCKWHSLQAARVLTLKHVYTIATYLNFEECCEVFRNCGWNFLAALENILE